MANNPGGKGHHKRDPVIVAVWINRGIGSRWSNCRCSPHPRAGRKSSARAIQLGNQQLARGSHSSTSPANNTAVLVVPMRRGVRSVTYSSDGSYLAAGDANGHVDVWPASGGTPKEELADPGSGGVNSVAFEASNQTIAAGDNNGHVYLFQPAPVGAQANPGSQGVLGGLQPRR